MKKIYVNKYIAFGAIFIIGVMVTNLIVHTVKVISQETPQAFAVSDAVGE